MVWKTHVRIHLFVNRNQSIFTVASLVGILMSIHIEKSGFNKLRVYTSLGNMEMLTAS